VTSYTVDLHADTPLAAGRFPSRSTRPSFSEYAAKFGDTDGLARARSGSRSSRKAYAQLQGNYRRLDARRLSPCALRGAHGVPRRCEVPATTALISSVATSTQGRPVCFATAATKPQRDSSVWSVTTATTPSIARCRTARRWCACSTRGAQDAPGNDGWLPYDALMKGRMSSIAIGPPEVGLSSCATLSTRFARFGGRDHARHGSSRPRSWSCAARRCRHERTQSSVGHEGAVMQIGRLCGGDRIRRSGLRPVSRRSSVRTRASSIPTRR
jgi:hypothetical protein